VKARPWSREGSGPRPMRDRVSEFIGEFSCGDGSKNYVHRQQNLRDMMVASLV